MKIKTRKGFVKKIAALVLAVVMSASYMPFFVGELWAAQPTPGLRPPNANLLTLNFSNRLVPQGFAVNPTPSRAPGTLDGQVYMYWPMQSVVGTVYRLTFPVGNYFHAMYVQITGTGTAHVRYVPAGGVGPFAVNTGAVGIEPPQVMHFTSIDELGTYTQFHGRVGNVHHDTTDIINRSPLRSGMPGDYIVDPIINSNPAYPDTSDIPYLPPTPGIRRALFSRFLVPSTPPGYEVVGPALNRWFPDRGTLIESPYLIEDPNALGNPDYFIQLHPAAFHNAPLFGVDRGRGFSFSLDSGMTPDMSAAHSVSFHWNNVGGNDFFHVTMGGLQNGRVYDFSLYRIAPDLAIDISEVSFTTPAGVRVGERFAFTGFEYSSRPLARHRLVARTAEQQLPGETGADELFVSRTTPQYLLDNDRDLGGFTNWDVNVTALYPHAALFHHSNVLSHRHPVGPINDWYAGGVMPHRIPNLAHDPTNPDCPYPPTLHGTPMARQNMLEFVIERPRVFVPGTGAGTGWVPMTTGIEIFEPTNIMIFVRDHENRPYFDIHVTDMFGSSAAGPTFTEPPSGHEHDQPPFVYVSDESDRTRIFIDAPEPFDIGSSRLFSGTTVQIGVPGLLGHFESHNWYVRNWSQDIGGLYTFLEYGMVYMDGQFHVRVIPYGIRGTYTLFIDGIGQQQQEGVFVESGDRRAIYIPTMLGSEVVNSPLRFGIIFEPSEARIAPIWSQITHLISTPDRMILTAPTDFRATPNNPQLRYVLDGDGRASFSLNVGWQMATVGAMIGYFNILPGVDEVVFTYYIRSRDWPGQAGTPPPDPEGTGYADILAKVDLVFVRDGGTIWWYIREIRYNVDAVNYEELFDEGYVPDYVTDDKGFVFLPFRPFGDYTPDIDDPDFDFLTEVFAGVLPSGGAAATTPLRVDFPLELLADPRGGDTPMLYEGVYFMSAVLVNVNHEGLPPNSPIGFVPTYLHESSHNPNSSVTISRPDSRVLPSPYSLTVQAHEGEAGFDMSFGVPFRSLIDYINLSPFYTPPGSVPRVMYRVFLGSQGDIENIRGMEPEDRLAHSFSVFFGDGGADIIPPRDVLPSRLQFSEPRDFNFGGIAHTQPLGTINLQGLIIEPIASRFRVPVNWDEINADFRAYLHDEMGMWTRFIAWIADVDTPGVEGTLTNSKRDAMWDVLRRGVTAADAWNVDSDYHYDWWDAAGDNGWETQAALAETIAAWNGYATIASWLGIVSSSVFGATLTDAERAALWNVMRTGVFAEVGELPPASVRDFMNYWDGVLTGFSWVEHYSDFGRREALNEWDSRIEDFNFDGLNHAPSGIPVMFEDIVVTDFLSPPIVALLDDELIDALNEAFVEHLVGGLPSVNEDTYIEDWLIPPFNYPTLAQQLQRNAALAVLWPLVRVGENIGDWDDLPQATRDALSATYVGISFGDLNDLIDDWRDAVTGFHWNNFFLLGRMLAGDLLVNGITQGPFDLGPYVGHLRQGPIVLEIMLCFYEWEPDPDEEGSYRRMLLDPADPAGGYLPRHRPWAVPPVLAADFRQAFSFIGIDYNWAYYVIVDSYIQFENQQGVAVASASPIGPQPREYSASTNVAGFNTWIEIVTPDPGGIIPGAPRELRVDDVDYDWVQLSWLDIAPLTVDAGRIEFEIVRMRAGQVIPDELLDRRDLTVAGFRDAMTPEARANFEAGVRTQRTGDTLGFAPPLAGLTAAEGATANFTLLELTADNRVRLVNNVLRPNTLYFYYVRTIWITETGETRSNWVGVSATTSIIQPPVNLRVLDPRVFPEANVDPQRELVIRFDAPVGGLGTGSVAQAHGSIFDFRVSLRVDNGPWADPVFLPNTVSAAGAGTRMILEPVPIAGRPGYYEFTYVISGLHPNTTYSIRVHTFDLINSQPIAEVRNHVYSEWSNTATSRTDVDQDEFDRDRDRENLRRYLRDLLMEFLRRPYWTAMNRDNTFVALYRPTMINHLIAENGQMILLADTEHDRSVFYLPQALFLRVWDGGQGFRVLRGEMEVTVPNQAFNNISSQPILTALQRIRDVSGVNDYYIRLTTDTRPHTDALIHGSPTAGLRVELNAELVESNTVVRELDESILRNLMYRIENDHYVDNIVGIRTQTFAQEIDNMIARGLSFEYKVRRLHEISRIIMQEMTTYVGTRLRATYGRVTAFNFIDQPIAIGLRNVQQATALGGYQLAAGTWARRDVVQQGASRMIRTQVPGIFGFSRMTFILPGINTLPNHNNLQALIIRHNLTEFLGYGATFELNAPISLSAVQGIVARIGGAPQGTNAQNWLTSQGYIAPFRGATAPAQTQEAIYTIMALYEIRTNTRVSQLRISNFNNLAGINGIDNRYRTHIQAAFELGIFTNQAMNPTAPMTVGDFLRMLIALDQRVGL
ncbi:MAG: hypothetical protein FWB74_00065 [Defluviitaleaceae bacterium]|nr:hypothetical protein [Defluviitaleaceae bacterium]